jgi:hypothetical protein
METDHPRRRRGERERGRKGEGEKKLGFILPFSPSPFLPFSGSRAQKIA